MTISTGALAGQQRRVAFSALSGYDVAAFAVFSFVFLMAIIPRFDADVWWHLFVGGQIAQHLQVPTHDFMSYTFRGKPWVDHEWLSEVGMFELYRFGGLQAVVEAFGLVIMTAYFLVYLLMRLKGVNGLIALLMTSLAAISAIGSWGSRVQMVTLLGAAFFCLALERFRSAGHARWLFALVAAMVVWANLHGGFVIGLVIVAIYIAGGILDAVRHRASLRQAAIQQKPLGLTLFGLLAVTLVNPNGYAELLYPLKFITPNSFTNVIVESLSPNFHLAQMLPFELLLLTLVASAFIARQDFSWTYLLLVLCFTHLALQETRNIALWGIVIAPIAAVYLQAAIQPLRLRMRRANRPVPPSRVAAINWILVVLLIVMVVTQSTRFVNARTIRTAENAAVPQGAVRYLQTHDVKGHGFNSYAFGGYIIWKLYPRYPVFIDSRADTVYDTRILAEYLKLYAAHPGWRHVIRKYDIRWILVESGAPVVQLLANAPRWRVAYKSSKAILMVRS